MRKSIIITLISFISFLSIFSQTCCASCPSADIDINPCECLEPDINDALPTAIRCFGKTPFDLANIFDTLNANISPENKNFAVFYMNNTGIEDIPEDVFGEITFERIYLDGTKKLKTIHSNAFRQSQSVIQNFHAWDTALNINSGNADNIQQFDNLINVKYLDFSSSNCPPSDLMSSVCDCTQLVEFERSNKHGVPVISCSQLTNSEELIETFVKLGTTLRHSKRNFFRLTIENSQITELPNDLFNGVTFSEIIIKECPKLSVIDKNIFQSIKPFVNRLTISNINLDNSSQQRDDLWYAISSLNNLIDVKLVNVFDAIPNYAFRVIDGHTQTRLQSFTHSGLSAARSVHKVGSFAFYNLPNIGLINLQSNELKSISRYAFANQFASQQPLVIDLSRNKLSASSFESGSLSGSRRPIKLKFGTPFVGCNPLMRGLNENAFSAFLDKEHNELDMGCAYLMDCDCELKWLYDAPVHWRNKITTGVFGDVVLPCKYDTDDGYEELSLWDLPDHYFQCQSRVEDERRNEYEIQNENDLAKLFNDILNSI